MKNQKKIYTTVRLEKKFVDRYKEIAKLNLIPVSILIQKAMENSESIFKEIGQKFSEDLDSLAIQLTGKRLVRK